MDIFLFECGGRILFFGLLVELEGLLDLFFVSSVSITVLAIVLLTIGDR